MPNFEECRVPGVREIPRNCAQAQILVFLRSRLFNAYPIGTKPSVLQRPPQQFVEFIDIPAVIGIAVRIDPESPVHQVDP